METFTAALQAKYLLEMSPVLNSSSQSLADVCAKTLEVLEKIPPQQSRPQTPDTMAHTESNDIPTTSAYSDKSILQDLSQLDRLFKGSSYRL